MGGVIRGICNQFFDISINAQKTKAPPLHGIAVASEPGAPQYQGFTIIHKHTILVRIPLDE